MFDEPESLGNGIRLLPRDIKGHLLLVWAVDYIPHSPTKFSQPGKPDDVIVVDVVDLDLMDDQGEHVIARRTWWRNNKLIQACRPKIGRPNPMLVRMGMEPSSMGANDAFALTSMATDPVCATRGQDWLNRHPDFCPSEANQSPPIETRPQPQWSQPPAPLASMGVPQPRASNQETLLERMARQAQENAARVASAQPLPPPAPQQFDTPPY